MLYCRHERIADPASSLHIYTGGMHGVFSLFQIYSVAIKKLYSTVDDIGSGYTSSCSFSCLKRNNYSCIQGKSRGLPCFFGSHLGSVIFAQFIIKEMENNCPNRKRHPVLRRET